MKKLKNKDQKPEIFSEIFLQNIKTLFFLKKRPSAAGVTTIRQTGG
jgi:hypothetical protein